jgi:hypothetical protein
MTLASWGYSISGEDMGDVKREMARQIERRWIMKSCSWQFVVRVKLYNIVNDTQHSATKNYQHSLCTIADAHPNRAARPYNIRIPSGPPQIQVIGAESIYIDLTSWIIPNAIGGLHSPLAYFFILPTWSRQTIQFVSLPTDERTEKYSQGIFHRYSSATLA